MATSSTTSWPLVIGFGNPLLDVTVNVTPEYLQRFELQANAAILAGPKHMPIYTEIAAMSGRNSCGGSCLNTMRAVQWMSHNNETAAFVGCIGNDVCGETLRGLVVQSGVKPLFMVAETAPTGTCAALITGTNRSLVTNLGAADLFKHTHFQSENIQEHIAHAQSFYAEGFFVTVATPTLVELGKVALATNKPFMFNLSATFLLEVPPFWKGMQDVLLYVDVLFGNETEAAALSKAAGWGVTDLEEIARRIGNMPKANAKRQRTVVITQGPDPTIVYHNGKVFIFETPVVPKAQIVDTNGAGDCFVGGFVAQFTATTAAGFNGPDEILLSECVRAGQYCALQCLKHVGCAFTGVSAVTKGMPNLMKALAFAADKHSKQKRLTGEPYIAHPIGVTRILAEAGVTDYETLCSAALHDCVEDTNTTLAELEALFGAKVRLIVSQVSDDKSLPKRRRKELQIEHAPHVCDQAKLVKLADKIQNLESIMISAPWSPEIARGYCIWGWFVCQGLFGVNSELDARARTVFRNVTVRDTTTNTEQHAIPHGATKEQLATLLSQYYTMMDEIDAAKKNKKE